MATERDLHVITWMAHQYTAHFYQIQALLTREPGAPLRGELISESVVKDQISRWKRAGWIEYMRLLADGRGWAWVTRKGLQLVGLQQQYTARTPSAIRLHHVYAVNEVRLLLEDSYAWTSERQIKSQLEHSQKGKRLGPIPDGVIAHPQVKRVAIEVEMTPKKPVELVNKLTALVRASQPAGAFGYEVSYPVIWFYVPNQRMKKTVEQACTYLREDEQQRISVALIPDHALG